MPLAMEETWVVRTLTGLGAPPPPTPGGGGGGGEAERPRKGQPRRGGGVSARDGHTGNEHILLDPYCVFDRYAEKDKEREISRAKADTVGLPPYP